METKSLYRKLHLHHQEACGYLHEFAKELIKAKGSDNIIRPNNVIAAIKTWDIENDSMVEVDVDIESISIDEHGYLIIEYSYCGKHHKYTSLEFSYDELYDILSNICACIEL